MAAQQEQIYLPTPRLKKPSSWRERVFGLCCCTGAGEIEQDDFTYVVSPETGTIGLLQPSSQNITVTPSNEFIVTSIHEAENPLHQNIFAQSDNIPSNDLANHDMGQSIAMMVNDDDIDFSNLLSDGSWHEPWPQSKSGSFSFNSITQPDETETSNEDNEVLGPIHLNNQESSPNFALQSPPQSSSTIRCVKLESDQYGNTHSGWTSLPSQYSSNIKATEVKTEKDHQYGISIGNGWPNDQKYLNESRAAYNQIANVTMNISSASYPIAWDKYVDLTGEKDSEIFHPVNMGTVNNLGLNTKHLSASTHASVMGPRSLTNTSYSNNNSSHMVGTSSIPSNDHLLMIGRQPSFEKQAALDDIDKLDMEWLYNVLSEETSSISLTSLDDSTSELSSSSPEIRPKASPSVTNKVSAPQLAATAAKAKKRRTVSDVSRVNDLNMKLVQTVQALKVLKGVTACFIKDILPKAASLYLSGTATVNALSHSFLNTAEVCAPSQKNLTALVGYASLESIHGVFVGLPNIAIASTRLREILVQLIAFRTQGIPSSVRITYIAELVDEENVVVSAAGDRICAGLVWRSSGLINLGFPNEFVVHVSVNCSLMKGAITRLKLVFDSEEVLRQFGLCSGLEIM